MRLISRMKRQTSRTIWKFLEQLGNHPEVCSRRLCGVKALLPLEVVFYASGNEVVLVGIDASSAVRSELADEERFCDETPLYFSESTHRASPVRKLTKVLEVWKDFAKEFFENGTPCAATACCSATTSLSMLKKWKTSGKAWACR